MSQFIKNLMFVFSMTCLAMSVQASDTKKRSKDDSVAVYTTVGVVESTGCWATLYSGDNFTGDSIDIVGPGVSNNLEFGPFEDWKGRVESLMVGPNANVYLYGDENRKDLDHAYKPNMVDYNVQKKPWWDKIESLVIECTS